MGHLQHNTFMFLIIWQLPSKSHFLSTNYLDRYEMVLKKTKLTCNILHKFITHEIIDKIAAIPDIV